jgi:hypothetical protein
VAESDEMTDDMLRDEIRVAIGKAHPSIDDMAREVLWENLDDLIARAHAAGMEQAAGICGNHTFADDCADAIRAAIRAAKEKGKC